MADRGELFVNVGTEVYDGMIIGERNRSEDLTVNITETINALIDKVDAWLNLKCCHNLFCQCRVCQNLKQKSKL